MKMVLQNMMSLFKKSFIGYYDVIAGGGLDG